MNPVSPQSGNVYHKKSGSSWRRWIAPITGLMCLIWFLIRVIPKPSRAAYPCQRVAFPIASAFVLWLVGLAASAAIFRRSSRLFTSSRYIRAVLCAAVGIGIIWTCLSLSTNTQLKAEGSTPANSPIGNPKGVHPGRVVWVHDPIATNWAGLNTNDGHWWQNSHTDPQRVDWMLQKSICALAGESDLAQAWDALIRYFNREQDKGDIGYTPGEKIMIKVNFVSMIAVAFNGGSPPIIDYNIPSSKIDYPLNSPQLMRSLLYQLVHVVGVAQSDIIIGDPICLWCHEFYDMIHPEFPEVVYLDYRGNYNRTMAVKSTVPFYWSTSHADGKAQDYVLQPYVDAAYFINMPVLKAHYSQAGITICAKNHYGSLRGPTTDTSLYYSLHMDTPLSVPANGNYRPMVDLMGHRDVGGKTLLCLIDGLYGGKHGKNPSILKWQTAPFNNDWPSSIFVSQDQVAIDSVGYDFLVNEWTDTNGPTISGTQDYLHEAALANNPPSMTFYDPERDGTPLASLGVHEHWNNPQDKQYSRNLGTGNGIELLKLMRGQTADFNDDGIVDGADLLIMSSQWLMPPSTPSADIAPSGAVDGIVNLLDFYVLSRTWLNGNTP